MAAGSLPRCNECVSSNKNKLGSPKVWKKKKKNAAVCDQAVWLYVCERAWWACACDGPTTGLHENKDFE
eukprot:m.114403 g.114403  ORF g.114403 m.114403 type:complete len:69 (+) comp16292_c0_seq1:499-705(+)